MTFELKDIPAPEESGLKALVQRRIEVLRFLISTSGLFRDTVLIHTFVSSLSRAGLMFGINATARTSHQGLGWSVVLVVVSAVVMLTASYYKRVRTYYLITRIMRRLRNRMTRRLLRANVDFLISSPHGQVYAAMTNEVGALSHSINNVILAIEALVLLVIAIPYIFYISWIVGVASIGVFVIGLVGYILIDRPARKRNIAASRVFAEYCDRVGDMLSGWKELRQRGTRRDAVETAALKTIEDFVNQLRGAERLYSGSVALGQSAVILLMCFVVIAVPFIQGGGPTQMFQVLTIIFLISGPAEMMLNIMPRLALAENAYYKILQVEKSLAASQSRALQVNGPLRDGFDKIELKGVEADVRELERPDADPFHLGPVDLTFTPGETVFICGGNGSGKTTLLSLITGLRHPDGGEILLDGAALTEDTASSYRELFSGVFSGYHLFDHAFGMNETELADLEKRIEQLGLSERVSLLGNKFSSTSLSAGQSRRLALSVALAENRPIIVLDEFAADQDPANRAYFYDVLVPELSSAGRLVLAVTHDDHQFGKCDRLIKMAAGRVISDERTNRAQEPAEAS